MTQTSSCPGSGAPRRAAGETQDLFRLLVQSATDYAIYALDPAGRIVSWNEGARRIKGYTAEEIVGRHFSLLYLPHEAKSGKPDYELRVAREEGRYEEEGWRVRKDGSRFWASVVVTALRDDAGRLVGFGKVTRDLTERKQAEDERAQLLTLEQKARAEAEAALERLRAIQNVAEATLAHLRLEDVLRALLDRIEEFMAVDTATVLLLEGDHLAVRAAKGLEGEVERGVRIPLGRGFAGRVASERQPLVKEDVDPADLVSPVLRESGVRSLLGVPLLVEGRLVGVLHVGTLYQRRFTDEDVRFLQLVADRAALAVEHARLYEQVRESEELFRLLVESVQDYAIFLLDPEGRIATWNRGAERIKGYTPQEIAGQPYATFFTEEDRAAGKPEQLLRRARAEGRAEEQGWRVRKDGVRFWADAVVTALYDAEACLRGYAKVTRDLTERHRIEEERERHAAELEQLVAERTAELQEVNAELDAFSYSVSHDLRAPLRAMRGFAEALLEDHAEAMNAEALEYARRIAGAAERMDRLVQDMLAYSRLSRAELRPHPISLAAVVAEALSGLGEDVRDRRARVQVKEPLPDVLAHYPTLVQVVSNLLGNALKFVAPGVRPSVRVWAEPRVCDGRAWVRLWVADNGIGIAPEHADRVFGVLERLHGSETYPGTGIGLAIVRRGVERLGGRAGLDSTPGRGSRFWVELPRAPVAPEQDASGDSERETVDPADPEEGQ